MTGTSVAVCPDGLPAAACEDTGLALRAPSRYPPTPPAINAASTATAIAAHGKDRESNEVSLVLKTGWYAPGPSEILGLPSAVCGVTAAAGAGRTTAAAATAGAAGASGSTRVIDKWRVSELRGAIAAGGGSTSGLAGRSRRGSRGAIAAASLAAAAAIAAAATVAAGAAGAGFGAASAGGCCAGLPGTFLPVATPIAPDFAGTLAGAAGGFGDAVFTGAGRPAGFAAGAGAAGSRDGRGASGDVGCHVRGAGGCDSGAGFETVFSDGKKSIAAEGAATGTGARGPALCAIRSSSAMNAAAFGYRSAGRSDNALPMTRRIETRCSGTSSGASVPSCSPEPIGRRPVNNSWAMAPSE